MRGLEWVECDLEEWDCFRRNDRGTPILFEMDGSVVEKSVTSEVVGGEEGKKDEVRFITIIFLSEWLQEAGLMKGMIFYR